jgi:hypothetical protein
MTFREKLLKRIESEALMVRIYEPKYGGKDQSGYDTLMKYEVNDDREECFIQGASLLVDDLCELVKAVETENEITAKAGMRYGMTHRAVQKLKAKYDAE